MKFCKECGKPLSEGAKFCKECGTTVGEVKNVSGQLTNESIGSISQSKTVVPMSKKTKKLLIVAGAAIVVLFGAYKLGETVTSKDRLIDRFETALVEKDEKAVAKLLSSNDKKMDFDAKSVEGFMEYFEKFPEEVPNLIQSLRAQSKVLNVDNKPDSSMIEEFAGGIANEFVKNGMVNLEKDGKVLFYNKFQLNVEPVYLSISTNYKDTELHIDGNKVGKATEAGFEETYGPYLPGFYHLKASLKTDFIELVSEQEVQLFGSSNKKSVDLYLDGQDVTLGFNVNSEDAGLTGKLFINGKDVGVNPFENPTFGPVLMDGTMTVAVEAKTPWGKVITNEVEINKSYLDINLGNSTAFQTEMIEQIMKYKNEYLAAYTSGDTTKMTTVTPNKLSSLNREIDSNKKYNYFYKGKHLSSSFDLDSFKVANNNGSWKLYVYVLEKLMEDDYSKLSEPEITEQENEMYYSLSYDEEAKAWLVDNSSKTYYFDHENSKEIEVENPIEYTSVWANISTEVEKTE